MNTASTDPRAMYEQHHAEYEAGLVPTQPLHIAQPPEDQSQPAPWWVVPAISVAAVAVCFFIAKALP